MPKKIRRYAPDQVPLGFVIVGTLAGVIIGFRVGISLNAPSMDSRWILINMFVCGAPSGAMTGFAIGKLTSALRARRRAGKQDQP